MTDDRYEASLTEWLRDEPIVLTEAPPASYDVAGLVSRGDRTRRRRLAVGASVSAVVVTLVSVGTPTLLHTIRGTSVAQPRPVVGVTIAPTIPPSQIPIADCTVEPLTVHFAGHSFAAQAIDPTGRYVIGDTDIEDGHLDFKGLLDRTTGMVTVLSHAVGTGWMAIGAGGTITGEGAGDQDIAWVYHDGQLTTLAVPVGKAAAGSAINARGDVVGVVRFPDGEGGFKGPTIAVEWPTTHPGTVQVLSAVPGSSASTITDDGRIGGAIGNLPYVWSPDGTSRALPVTWPGATAGSVSGIVGSKAIGQVWSDAGNYITTVWDLTTGTPNYYVYPSLDLNTQLSTNRRMLGRYDPGLTNPGAGTDKDAVPVFMTLDGKLSRLPMLPGSSNVYALSMSADGRTVVGVDSTGHSLIWHC